MALTILNEREIGHATLKAMRTPDALPGIKDARSVISQVLPDLQSRLVDENDADAIRRLQGAIQAMEDLDHVLVEPSEFIR